MVRLGYRWGRVWPHHLSECLELGAAAGFGLLGPRLEAVEEVGDLLLDGRFGAQAGVGRHLSRTQAQMASSALKSGL